jgi:hypothetical protein
MQTRLFDTSFVKVKEKVTPVRTVWLSRYIAREENRASSRREEVDFITLDLQGTGVSGLYFDGEEINLFGAISVVPRWSCHQSNS